MRHEHRLNGILILIMDIIFIYLSYIMALYVRFLIDIPQVYLKSYLYYMPLVVLFYIVPLCIFKMYSSVWNNIGIYEVTRGLVACGIGGLTTLFVMFFLPHRIPMIVVLVGGVFISIFIIGIRVQFRIFNIISNYIKACSGCKDKESILVVGAGNGGIAIIDDIIKQGCRYEVVGIIDDNKGKIGTYIRGIKVLGDREKIKDIVHTKNVDLILIAIPSLQGKGKRELIRVCQETNKRVKIIPGLFELIGDEINLNTARDVDLRDLLGRDEIVLDEGEIRNYISNKVVLITGGGGSIGSELCVQVARFSPKSILILDAYENNAYDIENKLNSLFPQLKKYVIIASVRDINRIKAIFQQYKPQVVFHAAAHKHVPLMEFNPQEAIKNNVIGTLNVAECASKYNTEKFVLISTDKAVNPTNVMGATKRLGEMIVQAINKESNTEFVAVRFGNVLGSNGSVIPLFKKQIEGGGPITLTDRNVTRYFMLITEAVQLVLQAGAYAKGGEVFVLDMGKPVKIYDLALELIRLSGFEPYKEIDVVITGLRPGEKLYEELLMEEEGLEETEHEKIFIGKSGDFSFKAVKEKIMMLGELAKQGDEEAIKRALATVVTTYKRDSVSYYE